MLDGRQHNTYDIEFYGPNPLCTIYYLAALRAVEELAQRDGRAGPGSGARARRLRAGSRRADELLWNGEYFVQRLDDVNAHKYQHGAGCLSDQLLGQLYARMLGLGDLLPAEHVRSAIGVGLRAQLQARLPRPRQLPAHLRPERRGGPAALHLAARRAPALALRLLRRGLDRHRVPGGGPPDLRGLVEEGLQIVKAVRDRHDGVRRNPWDEVECGHHYARSMSSWALLLALSGFHYDAADGAIAFAPAITGDGFPLLLQRGHRLGHLRAATRQATAFGGLTLDWGVLQLREVILKHSAQASH